MSKKSNYSFAEIYESHYQRVFKLCLGYASGDRELAKDLSQDIFFKVWEVLSGFRGESSISTWIYRIAANTCLMYLRKAKRLHKVQSEPEAIIEPAEGEDKENSIAHLYNAIGLLKEADRIIISLVLEEVTYPEIASIIGISESNLRVKIHRIKAKLSELIQQHG